MYRYALVILGGVATAYGVSDLLFDDGGPEAIAETGVGVVAWLAGVLGFWADERAVCGHSTGKTIPAVVPQGWQKNDSGNYHGNVGRQAVELSGKSLLTAQKHAQSMLDQTRGSRKAVPRFFELLLECVKPKGKRAKVKFTVGPGGVASSNPMVLALTNNSVTRATTMPIVTATGRVLTPVRRQAGVRAVMPLREVKVEQSAAASPKDEVVRTASPVSAAVTPQAGRRRWVWSSSPGRGVTPRYRPSPQPVRQSRMWSSPSLRLVARRLDAEFAGVLQPAATSSSRVSASRSSPPPSRRWAMPVTPVRQASQQPSGSHRCTVPGCVHCVPVEGNQHAFSKPVTDYPGMNGHSPMRVVKQDEHWHYCPDPHTPAP